MVIQRWQSVLLLVAAVMMGCFTFCSLGQVQTTDFTFDFTSFGFSYEGIPTDGAPSGTFLSTWYFFILSITTMIIFLIDIFLFRNLTFQKKVCLVGILLTIASAATGWCLGFNAIEGGETQWSTVMYVAPVISVVAAIMAYFRMNSDRRKLLAADRIR